MLLSPETAVEFNEVKPCVFTKFAISSVVNAFNFALVNPIIDAEDIADNPLESSLAILSVDIAFN